MQILSPPESVSLGMGPSDLCFKEPSSGFGYPIGFEIHCRRGFALIHISLCWLSLVAVVVVVRKTSLCGDLTYQQWHCF